MLTQTPRSTIHQRSQRGHYDRVTIYAVLDEALVCHVGFVADGQPVVIPTSHWRVGERLFFHGGQGSRLARVLATSDEVCVSVALVDGLVLARSAFHHSINYRSVVLFGRPEPVEDPEAKAAAFAILIDKLAPGRSAAVRSPTAKELAATRVSALPIAEGSAKLRAGLPVDSASDLTWPVWAGVIPVATVRGTPEPDEHVPPGLVDGMPI